MTTSAPQTKLLRLREVETIVGLGASSVYRRLRRGEFPAPVDIGGGQRRWLASEITNWIQSRPRVGG